jgi:dihydroneopterin aldolase
MAGPRHKPPLIVKLGGSLAASADLSAWIEALDGARQPLIIVPGGGAFADVVRTMQNKMGFDDAAAHHMALIAMQQYGIALSALWPRLSCAATPAAIRRALRLGQVPCWSPAGMVLAAALPKIWDITSDTLAAWLSGELKADKLLLIKSVDAPPSADTVADLAVAGIVDPLFPHYAAASGAALYVAGPQALAAAARQFRDGEVPGRKMRLA